MHPNVLNQMREDLIDENLHAAQAGRALVKRIEFGKELSKQIKEAKKQRKIIAKAGLSTKAIDLALNVYRGNYINNTQMVAQMKRMYGSACSKRDQAESVVKFVEKHLNK